MIRKLINFFKRSKTVVEKTVLVDENSHLTPREVYVKYFGEIPSKMIVVQLDLNPENKDPKNLTIMTRSDYMKFKMKKNGHSSI